jgi:hypothetical protein
MSRLTLLGFIGRPVRVANSRPSGSPWVRFLSQESADLAFLECAASHRSLTLVLIWPEASDRVALDHFLVECVVQECLEHSNGPVHQFEARPGLQLLGKESREILLADGARVAVRELWQPPKCWSGFGISFRVSCADQTALTVTAAGADFQPHHSRGPCELGR